VLQSLCPTLVKSNLDHVYISSYAPFLCKSVFKGEFKSRFVAFGIKASHHVEGFESRRGDL
jgi:hypothetical protein